MPKNISKVKSFNSRISVDLQEKIRDLCYAEHMTINEFVTVAATAFISYKEKKRNTPYPARNGQLKTGPQL